MNVLRPGSRRPARAGVLVMLAAVWLATGCGPPTAQTSEPATWRLDPAHEAPARDALVLYLLVQEVACANGSSPVDRMSEPSIQYSDSAVAITVGIRPLTGDVNCLGNPDVPVTVPLREPLGDRVLVNGGLGGVVSRTPSAHWPG